MSDTEEVALFVDWENIRYSMLNLHGQEPDPSKMRDKALKYGSLVVAKAYADFSEHEGTRRRLDVAGIEAEDYPLKLANGRRQSSADIHMVIDIIDTVLDRPQVRTFILMTGDRDFIRIAARLRNRFGKSVVISGVPGSLSHDLVQASTIDDPLEVSTARDRDLDLIRKIDYYEKTRHEGFHPTFSNLTRFLQHPVNHQMIDPNFVQSKLSQFVAEGVLQREVIETELGRELTVTRLNRDHPLVVDALLPVEQWDGELVER
ncbi:MAG: NYN domain-containing protein [Chloroflexi bacterium]|nr:NYN domain-containing protein [Chloroflexota bacterium]